MTRGGRRACQAGPPNEDFMRYGKIYEDILERVDLSPRAKVVAAALDMMRNPKSGQCNPTLDKLMQATGMECKATLHAALAELIEGGIIERKKEGRVQSFTLPWGASKVQPDEPNSSADRMNSSADRIKIQPAERLYIMNENEKEKEKEKEKGEEISFEEKLEKMTAQIRKERG